MTSMGYTYTSGEWFMHSSLGCSPIEMLYACTAGKINGICTACDTGFTLDAADNVCKPTAAGSFGYDWATSAAKVTSHTVYSNEQVFPPFAENSAAIDWRDWGVITPVQDVGSTCAAEYAQTAADLASAAWSIKTGTANVLPSIQMVIDCETVSSDGCAAGTVQAALGAYATLGVYSEAQWPYTEADSGSCHLFEKGKIPFNHLPKFALEQPGFEQIPNVDRVALRRALRDGPVSFSFNALSDFESYTSGTYMGTNCDTASNTVNHSMVAVGYDTDGSGNEYIIAKNSWGTSWGISGYANIYVNPEGFGTCGMFVEVNHATAGKGSRISHNMVDNKALL